MRAIEIMLEPSKQLTVNTDTLRYFTKATGYEIWRDPETHDWWIKKGNLIRGVSASAVIHWTPDPEDAPSPPKAKAKATKTAEPPPAA